MFYEYGQSVRNTYIHASYFVRFDTYHEDIKRLFDVLRGDPIATPSKDELAMTQAYIMAMRSADLNRQVGAVITDDDGNLIATGCNEVPKFGGGLYWPDEHNDLRDFFVTEDGVPISQKIKNDIIKNITEVVSKKIGITKKIKTELVNEFLNKGDIKDLIEFLRPAHAEEAAICDAALRGVSTKNKTLYSNTYPCHLCTKKIIAAGIKRVVYIDPYPKSKAEQLYKGIMVDKPSDDLNCDKMVFFDSFTGFSPKKYSYMFNIKYKKRINKDTGKVIPLENLSFPNDIIYVSHYTPSGYLMKEEAYIYWMLKNNKELREEIKSTIKLKFENYIKYYNEETSWMKSCIYKMK